MYIQAVSERTVLQEVAVVEYVAILEALVHSYFQQQTVPLDYSSPLPESPHNLNRNAARERAAYRIADTWVVKFVS